MKNLLVSSMLIISSVAIAEQTAGTLDPAQVYTTGNIVQPTVAGTGQTPWVNGVYQDQLTCWAWGNPGNCGPNPSVRPGNLINYSFGLTDLYQVQAISSILPTTGLRVNGYNFSFTAKNGNGWDDGRTDTLNAYVSFYGTDGKVKDYTSYNLNYKFDWTTFNYTKDFVTPYADKDLSTVRYGFVGKDNNYWAGNYGPEIYNINFSLKYSVDPCATNVLSSPACPGYTEALLKSLPTTSTTIDPITTTSSSPGTTTSITTDPVTSTVNVSSTTTIGQPTIVSPIVPNIVTTSSNSAMSSQTTKESSGSSSNTSLALSIISKNSERDAAGAAVAQSAVSQAAASATQAQQEALSVAGSAVFNSTTTSQSLTGGQQLTGTGIKASSESSFSLQVSTSSISSFMNSSQTNSYSTQQTSGLGLPQTLSQIEQTQTQQIVAMSNTIQTTNESYNLISPNTLTDKSNPLNDAFEQKQILPQSNVSMSTGPIVNRNAQDNEAAGGVSINRMALTPTGYGDYLNFTLRDVAFYQPKEMYKNQRNVDNARALRQMTNDSRHKELVELQYNR